MNNVTAIIGDEFFFKTAELSIVNKYKISSSNISIINFKIENIDDKKLISICTPTVFDMETKLIVLRYPDIKIMNEIIKKCEEFHNILILIESDKQDKRSKVFKELCNQKELIDIGFFNGRNNVLDLALKQMNIFFGIEVEKDIHDFILKKYTKNNDYVYNIYKIFNDLMKAKYIKTPISVDALNLVMTKNKSENIFGLMDALKEKNIIKCINLLNDQIEDLSDVKKALGLILSELDIINRIKIYKCRTLNDWKNKENNKIEYKFMEDNNDFSTKELHPYRFKKIFEASNTIFYQYSELFTELTKKAIYKTNFIHSSSYKVPLYSLVYSICTFSPNK